MIDKSSEPLVILGIAPCAKGFGFALLEGEGRLVDWGLKPTDGDKNSRAIKKLNELIAHYRPSVIILRNASGKGSRRAARIRNLNKTIVKKAAKQKIKVKLISRTELWQSHGIEEEQPKQALAQKVAERFPAELYEHLPRERQPWTSEEFRVYMFEAVALTLAFLLRKSKREATYGRPPSPKPNAPIEIALKDP